MVTATETVVYDITLHYIIYSGISKSNFKDHYGDVVITQCNMQLQCNAIQYNTI